MDLSNRMMELTCDSNSITIPVNINIDKYEYKKNNHSNLKLYRKNTNKDNIFDKINLNMS